MTTILQLCEHFGGKDTSLHGVARAFLWEIPLFDKKEFRVLLCSRKGYDKAAEQMIQGGLSPFYLGYGKFDIRNLIKLLRIIKTEKIDIIHAHGFGACLWARLAEWITHIPIIIHERGNYGKIPLYMYPIEKFFGPRTKYGLAVSKSTKEFMTKKRFIPEKTIQVIYNGILLKNVPQKNSEWIYEFRAQHGISKNDKLLGVVGRIIESKGLIDAFLALEILLTKTPNVYLWILGDGDYTQYLKQWLKEHKNIENRVRFFGFRSDVLEIIQCFDIEIFPSHHEGTPNTLYEAMAVGKTMVATPVDGQGEILENNVTALFHDVANPTEMAEKIYQVLTNKELAQRLSYNAQEKIKELDGMKNIETKQALYRTIMKEKLKT